MTFTVGAIRGRSDGALRGLLVEKLRVTPDQKPNWIRRRHAEATEELKFSASPIHRPRPCFR